MTMTDPIADMLTRIRNANRALHASASMPTSRMKEEIARILKEEGYIEAFEVLEQKPYPVLQVTLKYHGARRERRPVITNITRISKPGRRVYRGRMDLPRVMSGIGIAIVTTPKGVMTAAQARRERVGGEVLCYVW